MFRENEKLLTDKKRRNYSTFILIQSSLRRGHVFHEAIVKKRKKRQKEDEIDRNPVKEYLFTANEFKSTGQNELPY